eukprot:233971-Pelagomonas_calceolata.AAC.2
MEHCKEQIMKHIIDRSIVINRHSLNHANQAHTHTQKCIGHTRVHHPHESAMASPADCIGLVRMHRSHKNASLTRMHRLH